MKNIIIFNHLIKLSIISFLAVLHLHNTAYAEHFLTFIDPDKQFPNPDQIYVPGKDTGFAQYAALSLRKSNKIVLTFDDGPDPVTTPELLDILKKENVQATFFVLTDKVTEETKPLVRRMIEEGHTVASHHHDHVSNDTKTEAVYKAGLKKTILSTVEFQDEYGAINREIYYRFPYGAYGSKSRSYHHLNVMKSVSQDLFADNCINFAFWDIDTVDWLPDMSSAEIAQNVMANIIGGTGYDFKRKSNGGYQKVKKTISKPLGGGVVLMHDVHSRTVKSIEILLKKLRENNVEIVQLRDVKEYSYNGKQCSLK
jgi:peptidoglycan/xylan/chitin deacetylase (PgdA/CDA1 family)